MTDDESHGTDDLQAKAKMTEGEKNDDSPENDANPTSQNDASQSMAEKMDDGFKTIPPPICRYYRTGRCKRGNNCNYQHPDICPEFMRRGLKKFNLRGDVTRNVDFSTQ